VPVAKRLSQIVLAGWDGLGDGIPGAEVHNFASDGLWEHVVDPLSVAAFNAWTLSA
jgi:hypothetical protein